MTSVVVGTTTEAALSRDNLVLIYCIKGLIFGHLTINLDFQLSSLFQNRRLIQTILDKL